MYSYKQTSFKKDQQPLPSPNCRNVSLLMNLLFVLICEANKASSKSIVVTNAKMHSASVRHNSCFHLP